MKPKRSKSRQSKQSKIKRSKSRQSKQSKIKRSKSRQSKQSKIKQSLIIFYFFVPHSMYHLAEKTLNEIIHYINP